MDKKFDPEGAGVPNGNYFALPFSLEESSLVLISAPWDVTVSYRAGTSSAPKAIINASAQVDLYDIVYGELWRKGIGTFPESIKWKKSSAALRSKASIIIDAIETGKNCTSGKLVSLQQKINAASRGFNEYIFDTANNILQQGKRVGLIGGDHSSPYGLIRALAKMHDSIGILHIDAHADLRPCYEGFEFSHASIMYNILQNIHNINIIVQVGVRDLCAQEWKLACSSERVKCFDMYYLAEKMFEGNTWGRLCDEIIDNLPSKVYVSCDIDGLSPDNCPHTGTPVPGGLSFLQTSYLLQRLNHARKQVVGFDLCETSPLKGDEWDALVGARLLYKLCGCLLN